MQQEDKKGVCFPLEAVFELCGDLPAKMGEPIESEYKEMSINVQLGVGES